MTTNILHTLDSLTPADADRYARVLLAHIVASGDRDLGELIALDGAVETLLRILETPVRPGADARLYRVRDAARPILTDPATAERARTILDADATILTPSDPNWPSGLAALGASAPIALFARGDTTLLRASQITCITGSRTATGYGAHTATELTESLAGRGHLILSGGQYGIDAAVHRAAAGAGRASIVVLAGGVEHPYPASHEALFDRIVADGGLLVSEVLPGFPPSRQRFLRRNQLLAALAHRIVIVEAGARSGTFGVVEAAEQLRRPVGAVPGPITSTNSTGCHLMIRDGLATLVTTATEIEALAAPAPSGEYPALDSLDAFVADWEDDPDLDEADRALLAGLPVETVQAELTARATAVAGGYYSLLDSVRMSATRNLLEAHRTSTDE